MLLRRLLISIVMLLLQDSARCQVHATAAADSSRVLSFSGTIDTYYHRSFRTVEDAPRTSFSNLPGFSLGMINLIMEYSGSGTGFKADVVFGPRGTDALFNAPRYRNLAGASSSQIINQMFVYYAITENVRLNVGQFNTFFGYEAISPLNNTQYSTSYLFSYGPFNHTGVWADVAFSKQCSAKLAVMNPTDYTEFNPFNSYTVGGQLAFKGKRNAVAVNFSYGDPDGDLKLADSIGTVSAGNALQFDLTGSFNVSDQYAFGISASRRSISQGQQKIAADDRAVLERCGYYGIALYQTLRVNDAAALGLRSEYFYEYNNGVHAIGSYSARKNASVVALTLSGDLRLPAVRVIPELRFDQTSTRCFTLAKNGEMVRKMVSVNLAVVYIIPVITHNIR